MKTTKNNSKKISNKLRIFNRIANTWDGWSHELSKEVLNHYWSFLTIPNGYKLNRKFVSHAVELNGTVLTLMADVYKDDKEVAILALNSSADSIHFISQRLLRDKDIIALCETLVFDNPQLLVHLSNKKQNDKKFIFEIARYNGRVIKFISNNVFRDNKKLATICVKQFSRNFEFFSERLQNDEDLICLKSVDELEENADLFLDLPIKAREKRKFILYAISRKATGIFKYLPESLKKDKEISLAFLKNCRYYENAEIFSCASKKIRNDKEILLSCLEATASGTIDKVLASTSKKLKNDPDVLSLCLWKKKKFFIS